MKLYIKYMVSLRCKMILKGELAKLKVPYIMLDMDSVETREDLTDIQHEQLKKSLRKSGLELLENDTSILIDKIKNVVNDIILHSIEMSKKHYADQISESLNHDYNYLSDIFSETKGISIEQYITIHKIERVKEMLLYEDLNLTQICRKLNYKNVTTLTFQFKKITGLTPAFYKQMKQKRMDVRHKYEAIVKTSMPQ